MSAKRLTTLAVTVLLLGILAATICFSIYWPFTPARVTLSLEWLAKSHVRFGSFHKTYFPPGYALTDFVVERDGAQPFIRARSLTVQSSWRALLTASHTIALLRAEALHVSIPHNIPPETPVARDDSPDATVRELRADGAVLDFARDDDPALTLHLGFPAITLKNVSKKSAVEFDTVILNSEPPSQIKTKGSVGPWPTNGDVKRSAESLPVLGEFHMSGARLDKYDGISGILSSDGKFNGALSAIQIEGSANIQDFEITRTRHAINLSVHYSAHVNGLNADTVLDSVEAAFLGTKLSAKGSVATLASGSGKTVTIDLKSDSAYVQDLMRMCMRSEPAPLTGPIKFTAHVVLPPQRKPFLRQIRLAGDFGIDDAVATKPATQNEIDSLSARARGKRITSPGQIENDPERVLSQLSGHVDVARGTAAFTHLHFNVPAAEARLHGTFGLVSEQVNLSGTLTMEASVSQASKGFKSILLKPFDGLFRKKPTGNTVVPVYIVGRFPNPTYGTTLTGSTDRARGLIDGGKQKR